MKLRRIGGLHLKGLLAVLVLANSCGFGPGAEFTMSHATVDLSYSCPPGASNAPYDLHASIDSHNGTSSSVSIKTVAAIMTLAAVQGSWLQQVGFKYNAGNVAFAPDQVAAGSAATIKVTIPSACTNRSAGSASSADYSIALTVTTSAGTFKLVSTNRHRIIAS